MTTFEVAEVALPGCAPAPLASYLKALGILRLVAEQADADVRGWWQGNHFVLASTLDADGLKTFFLNEYIPSPIVSPWNGRAGFLEGDDTDSNRSGAKVVREILNATHQRFARIKFIIEKCNGNTAIQELKKIRIDIKRLDKRTKEVVGQEKNIIDTQLRELNRQRKNIKFVLVSRLRAELPDEFLFWFDACQSVASKFSVSPLLQGGLDGSTDFGVNFSQFILELIDHKTGQPRNNSNILLCNALFDEPVPDLEVKVAIGRFAPGSGGGPNATTGIRGESLANIWNFVLMLEGAIVFAAAATRRNETADPAVLSFPFAVRTTAAGSGQAALKDEGSSRTELWMPLWARPAGYAEVRGVLAEGRVTLGRRPVRDGLDFVRAVSKLGVDRGISHFQRYGLMQRSGDAYLATPLTQVRVDRNARADLIDQLDTDGWLDSFRRLARQGEAPARLSGIGRRLDRALFDLATPDGKTATADAARVQAALVALGEAVHYLAHSPKAREAVRFLPRLDQHWAQVADDASDDFRLAAAIAGLGAGPGAPSGAPPLLAHIAPVADRGGRWAETSQQRVVWGEGALIDKLVRVLRRRLIDAERAGATEKPLGGTPGADLAAIASFLSTATDDARIEALVRGLALVKEPRLPARKSRQPASALPAAYAALKPLFMPEAVLRAERLLAAEARLPLPATLLGQLLSGDPGRLADAIDQAQSRARIAGFGRSFVGLGAAGLDGRRLAAALLIPIHDDNVRRNLVAIAYPDTVQQEGSVP